MPIGIMVSNGQTYTVEPFEIDFGDTVLAGGTLDVLSRGTIVDTVVSGTPVGSAIVNVSAGGFALFTTVIDNGFLNIDGGAVFGATITDSTEKVFAGGTAIDTTVSDGALFVDGGTVNGTTLTSNSDESVFDGGTTIDTTVPMAVSILSAAAAQPSARWSSAPTVTRMSRAAAQPPARRLAPAVSRRWAMAV
jgi:autotransporter passenger strand-loop-strand repeat protein